MENMKSLVLLLAASFALVACGGGGSDPAPVAAAPVVPPVVTPQLTEGLYLGKNINDIDAVGRTTALLVLENGEVWGRTPYAYFGHGTFKFTGSTSTSQSTTTGGVTISATQTVNIFRDDKAIIALRDSEELGELPMELRITQGTDFLLPSVPSHANLAYSGGSRATPGTGYDYDAPARVADIAGPFGPRLTIGATGALTGTSSGLCTVNGQFTPRPSGKNVFNLTVTLAGCADAGDYSGVMVAFKDYAGYDSAGPFDVPSSRIFGHDEAHTKTLRL